MLFIALLFPAYLGVTGYDFNGLLGFADPAAYGFAAGAPAYPELMASQSGSWVFGAIIIIGFTVGLLIWLPQTMLLISRSMFAWSFDRILPARLSYVDPRTHSPVSRSGSSTCWRSRSTAIYAFTDWFSTLAVLLGLSLTLIVTAFGAILLPYRQREMVENSPYGGASRRHPDAHPGGPAWRSSASASRSPSCCGTRARARASARTRASSGSASASSRSRSRSTSSRSAVAQRQGIDLSLTYRELPPE